jgi:hypothetical protein
MSSDFKKREYFRVPAQLRVFFCLDSMEARHAMIAVSDIWSSSPLQTPETIKQFPGDTEKFNYDAHPCHVMLQWLNFKIDTLLYQMRVLSRDNVFSNHLVTSDLSITGFGFAHRIDAPLNSKLLFSLHLPDNPVRPIYGVGKLSRNGCDDESGREVGAILFEDVADSDRERIARYIFSHERKSKLQQTTADND